VRGDVTAGAAYSSGDSSVVEGNVSASGDITLGANSRILGTVHSGTGVISYGAGATVGSVI
jgi:cytoskeletal protein CcmA (bactofilin family)